MSLLGEARDLALDRGLWWPEGDPGRLRHLAHAWEAAAAACDFAADDVVHVIRRVRLDNEGRAIDALANHSDLVVLELGDEADRCRQVAGTLHGRANDIEQARRRIEALAVEVATALVAGALLTLFTGGVSDLMAAELTATAVADADAIGLTMSESAIALTARIAAYATLGAWEAGVIDITTQTAGNVVQNRDPFEGFSEQRFMIDVGTGAVLGGLVGGLTFESHGVTPGTSTSSSWVSSPMSTARKTSLRRSSGSSRTLRGFDWLGAAEWRIGMMRPAPSSS